MAGGGANSQVILQSHPQLAKNPSGKRQAGYFNLRRPRTSALAPLVTNLDTAACFPCSQTLQAAGKEALVQAGLKGIALCSMVTRVFQKLFLFCFFSRQGLSV